MKKRVVSQLVLVVGLAFAAVILRSDLGLALHRQTPGFLQVTSQTGGNVGRIVAWKPDFWAFQSSGDIVGNGNGNANIFQYDHALRILGGVPGLRQISCGPFGASKPSLSKRSLIVFEADGGLCAFTKNNCNQLANPTTGRQIFLYNPETRSISQLTACPGDCINPHLAGNGKRLLFDSTTELIGGGGIGNIRELYQADLRRLGPACPQLPCASGQVDPGVVRLTFGGGQNGVQSFNGRKVAFESSGDLLNGGANPGIQNIYLLDTRRGHLKQLSGGNFDARAPSINQSGRFVAFEEDELVKGVTPLVSQIFFAAVRRKSVVVTRLTQGGLPSFGPSIDARGRRVAFTSAADLLGLGFPGNQAYTFNVRRNELIQLTAGPAGAGLVESTTGTLLGFRSPEDLTGNGNTDPQFFVANFFRRAPAALPSLFPGTPTPGGIARTPTPAPTPIAGEPFVIGLSLVGNDAVDNGNNTVTTIIAATVGDFYANPVPDSTLVSFGIEFPTDGAIISNGRTGLDPSCSEAAFEAATGIDIINRAGVAHACLTYPGAEAGTSRTVTAKAGGTPGRICVGGSNAGNTCAIDFDCIEGSCEIASPGAFASGTILLPTPVAWINACTANGQPCTDGNPCTVGDVCAGGLPDLTCVGGTNDGSPCTIAAQCPFGSCEMLTPPICQPGAPVVCFDDGDPCTIDVCNLLTGACGTAPECPNDDNPCTDDVCNPFTGVCGINNAEPCDDQNPCTIADVCSIGACQPGAPVLCPDDSNDCTADVCNPNDGLCGIPVEPCGCSVP